MHDYTVRLIHTDRMAQLEREADAARLVAEAKRGRPHQTPPAQHPLVTGFFRALVRISPGRARVALADVTLRAE
jgi:hypothetical protein